MTPSQNQAVKEFLGSNAGIAMLEELKGRRPRAFGGSEKAATFEDRALRGTEMQAWDDCIEAVKSCGVVRKQRATSAGHMDMTPEKKK